MSVPEKNAAVAAKPDYKQSPRFTVACSPHITSGESVHGAMLDVMIALVPALGVSTYFFGPRALLMTLVTMVACVVFEYLYRRLLHKSRTIGDLSACVTGMLLAMCLPVNAPYWMAIVGAFFAIVIVKQLYGGLGKNFMNPALAGRVFLFSFPALMNTWVSAGTDFWSGLVSAADAVTSATPMASLHQGVLPDLTLTQMLVGAHGGSMGEVSAIALILGGIYLLLRKVITPRIPLCYIGTVAVLTFLFPLGGNGRLDWMLYSLLGGGLMLGAIFMATDYVTSPVTPTGQVFYAVGCGALTVFLRYFGTYPEGVSFAILVMNAFAWLFDKAGKPHRFGTPRLWQKKKGGKSA
jgi:electron transport complex protein RnfD